MALMICTKEHVYGGAPRSVGERFEVEDRFVPVEIRLGRAVVAPAPHVHRESEERQVERRARRAGRGLR